jgi:hypothetical protein
MSKKPETRFKERIRPLLEALPHTWVVKVQQVVIRGTPDFLLCVRGQFVAIELKTEDGQASALQDYNIGKIINAGGMAVIVDPENWPEVYQALKQMASGAVTFDRSVESGPKIFLS